MGKSSQEKIDYAIALLKQGKTFRDIQKQLKNEFGSSMSFSTLTKLKEISAKNAEETEKIQHLERELALFKRLYFELLDKNEKEGVPPK